MWNELQDPFEVKKAKYLNSIEMERGSFSLKGRMVAILGSLCGLCGLCPCRVESSHRPYIIHKGPACAPTTLFMHTGIRISNFFYMSRNTLFLLSHSIPKPFTNIKIFLGLLVIQKSGGRLDLASGPPGVRARGSGGGGGALRTDTLQQETRGQNEKRVPV